MVSDKPRRILVAYSMSSTFTPTTLHYLDAIRRFSNYEVHYVHVTHNAVMGFDFNDYDVLFHNYCARLCFPGYISSDYERSVLNFRGLKIVAVQDDYDRTATLHQAIRRLGFHVLLTCIQPEFWPLVHPRSELPGVKIIQGLTGYVPEHLIDKSKCSTPLADRKIWIAYRGREIGAKYGRLGFDKYEIGRRMIEVCEDKNIPYDISTDFDSRIYGDAWFDFLGSSRTILGTESGSNVFDFDGCLEQSIQRFRDQKGRPPTYAEFEPILNPLEAPFNVGQISPRVFECAIMRTPMILFRGRYSDAIKPDVHYIPLEKDFSNIDDVLEKVADVACLEGFATRAYDRLVSSGDYGYRNLSNLITAAIEQYYPEWIDQEWVRCRNAYCMTWRSPVRIREKSIEGGVRGSLVETPTVAPLSVLEFETRQAKYDALLQSEAAQRAVSRRTDLILVRLFSSNSISMQVAKKIWHLIPAPMRRRIYSQLTRH